MSMHARQRCRQPQQHACKQAGKQPSKSACNHQATPTPQTLGCVGQTQAPATQNKQHETQPHAPFAPTASTACTADTSCRCPAFAAWRCCVTRCQNWGGVCRRQRLRVEGRKRRRQTDWRMRHLPAPTPAGRGTTIAVLFGWQGAAPASCQQQTLCCTNEARVGDNMCKAYGTCWAGGSRHSADSTSRAQQLTLTCPAQSLGTLGCCCTLAAAACLAARRRRRHSQYPQVATTAAPTTATGTATAATGKLLPLPPSSGLGLLWHRLSL